MQTAIETTEQYIELEGRKIMYDVTGDGPPIVFVHGVWATGGVWYPVIDRLASRFRCINIHLPLGVHRYASPRTVDHTPAALARIIAALIAALDLHDVTLVGNDTGGALCQLVITTQPQRIARLVLTNCDAYEIFPPKILAPLYLIAKVPALWTMFSKLLRGEKARKRFFATISNSTPDDANLKMLMSRFSDDADVREDLRLTIVAIGPHVTLEAAKHFAAFTKPVLVLWATDDAFFPTSLGERLQRAFPNATLQLVENAKLFLGLDQPEKTAEAIGSFAAAHR